MNVVRSIVWVVAIVLATVGWAVRPSQIEPAVRVLDELAVREPIEVTRPPGSIEALRERIGQVLATHRVPGVGIALVDREGIIWAGGVGVADVQTQAPVTGDTVFRVASITKSFVALGVARLHGQGRLDLDAPLSQTLPELPIDDRFVDTPVTLAHALEHTAGFDDMRFNEWFVDDDAMPPAAALAINPRSRALRWRPGSRMSYSNVGYTIAGLAIERATGEPFDRYLEREVLRPLGIERAAFARTDDLRARLATGYRDPETVAPFLPIAHRPAGSLLASATDLGKLVHAWLVRDDRVVPPAALKRIERTQTAGFPRTDINYGLGNYGDVGHPVRGRGHDGGLPGFTSCYRYFPELGVGYVMLLNATHSHQAYAEIRALLFAFVAQGKPIADPPRASDDAHRYAGYYAFANPRHELFGFLERTLIGFDVSAIADDRVRLTPSIGGPIELVATGDGGFRHPLESGTSVRFGSPHEGAAAERSEIMTAGFVHGERTSGAIAKIRVRALVFASQLLQLAPLWALGWIVVRGLRRRGLAGASLHALPALASLALVGSVVSFAAAAKHDALGIAHPYTVALCVCTIAFAIASAAALATCLRTAVSADRPPWYVCAVPSLAAVSAFALTLWLGAHGIIGLRTWAW